MYCLPGLDYIRPRAIMGRCYGISLTDFLHVGVNCRVTTSVLWTQFVINSTFYCSFSGMFVCFFLLQTWPPEKKWMNDSNSDYTELIFPRPPCTPFIIGVSCEWFQSIWRFLKRLGKRIATSPIFVSDIMGSFLKPLR